MYQPLPEFPPLFPPGEWWRSYLKALTGSLSQREAIMSANSLTGIKSRDWMRIRLAEGSVISLPVEGGACALKNRHPSTWILASEARRDSRKFMATLATLYGRKPFFHLCQAELEKLFSPEDADSQRSAESFCNAAFTLTERFLTLHDREMIKTLDILIRENNRRIADICRRLTAQIDSRLSILDSVLRLGPDAIFTLIPSF